MLAVGVMPPLRNGNMQYDMIGMKIEISSTSDASISVPEEAWQKAKGNGLQKTRPKDFEEGEVPTFEAVGALLKELSGQNVIKPTDRFRVPDNTSSVPCSFATDSGHLFFFQKQLLFVPKPMYWRPYSRLEVVEFKDTRLLNEGSAEENRKPLSIVGSPIKLMNLCSFFEYFFKPWQSKT